MPLVCMFVTAGGELAFIQRMVADSASLRGRIHWYSSMLGKKATLKALRAELQRLGVTALRTTELAQGKTSRWAIAWSFAVPRGKASQPLPRPAPGPPAPPAGSSSAAAAASGSCDRAGFLPTAPALLPGLNTPSSFVVESAHLGAPKLLQLLQHALDARGMACRANAAHYSIEVSLLQAGHQQGSGADQRGVKRSRPDDENSASDVEPRAAAAEVATANSSLGSSSLAVAAGGSAGACEPGSGALAVTLQVLQHQRGTFVVQATTPRGTSKQQQGQVTALLRQLQQDVMAHVAR